MASPISLRLPGSTIDRLGLRAREAGIPPRTLAQRYVEEGLRLDEHPLVRFAEGPGGRRARLSGTGSDVWEVIEAVADNRGAIPAAAAYLELPLGLVQAAVAYYGAFTDEIDEWIERNRRQAADAQAAWSAGRAALSR